MLAHGNGGVHKAKRALRSRNRPPLSSSNQSREQEERRVDEQSGRRKIHAVKATSMNVLKTLAYLQMIRSYRNIDI